ncbi:hypothetical protein [Flavobacterium sp.]|uniref:hypothetical protein n=1 Tax=Flavobacterium sp. TaxID=239 RepID=UPI003752FAD5
MYTQNIFTNKYMTENKTRLLFFFILFLLSSIGMFGQTNETLPTIDKTQEIIFTSDVASVNSQVEFVSWFMGTKQSKMINVLSTANESSKVSTKKQILFSGSTPNKVLYRTLMKKLSSQSNAIV